MNLRFVILAAAAALACPASGQVLTPFVAYTRNLVGTVTTNPVTIESWTYTNTITGVSTNLVLNFSQTYTPAASNGYFGGELAPGNYRLTVDGLSRGIVFGMPSSSSTQNLAQLAGVPVYAFINFTLAQFSDAGTAAYSNATAFTLASELGTAGRSNAAAFVTPAQWTNLFTAYILAVSNLYKGAFIGNAAGLTNLQPTAFTSGTNAIGETETLLTNFVNRSQSQGISGDKTFTGSVLISNLAGVFHVGNIYSTNFYGIFTALSNGLLWGVSLTNANYINGNFGAITGGVWEAGIARTLTMTNGGNFGTAFRSHGTGTGSEQFGTSADAIGDNSIAFGPSSVAGSEANIAIGVNANTTNYAGIAIGNNTATTADYAIALGNSSSASADGSVAIGASAAAGHTNSMALGVSSATDADNQIMLGTASIDVKVNNNLTVGGSLSVAGNQTNGAVWGTNSFSDIAFRRYANSSLVNGDNAAVLVGTNTFVQVSGPSSAFTIHGLNGSPNRNGHMVIILNKTGQNMTIANESGIEPTAANRIINMTGGDRATTANGAAWLIYDSNTSRWQCLHVDP